MVERRQGRIHLLPVLRCQKASGIESQQDSGVEKRRGKKDTLFSPLQKGKTIGIIHVGNTAGVGSVLARFQGHERVYCFDVNTAQMFGGKYVNWRNPFDHFKFLRALDQGSVWHYHYPNGTLWQTLQGKKHRMLLHFHGDDLRKLDRKYEEYCIVSTPDLIAYTSHGQWLPTPIDLNQIKAVVAPVETPAHSKNKVRIAHYPYYNHHNHEDAALYQPVLADLPANCEVVTIDNMPHHKALQVMASCDIVIGKVDAGMKWFGKFELEGMALGKPVIAYVSDELFSEYQPRIYRTTEKTFAKDLWALVESSSLRESLGNSAKNYVENLHDASKIVRELEKHYDRV